MNNLQYLQRYVPREIRVQGAQLLGYYRAFDQREVEHKNNKVCSMLNYTTELQASLEELHG
eukprot:10913491-Prorocentrum_lima.AAC.1